MTSMLQSAYNDLALTNSRLRTRIEELEKEVKQLRASIGSEIILKGDFKVTQDPPVGNPP